MSNTFMKKGLRGFTLIELLVVIAIIGLLSTIIAAPIQNARKKAKDVKKMAEIKSVASALEQYAEANGQYPEKLQDLAPKYMPVLPTYVVASTVAAADFPLRDRFAYVVYTGTPAGGAATRYGYHLGVHLDVYAEALKSDRDCTGATNGATLATGNCVWFLGASTISYPDWVTGMVEAATSPSATADFEGAEGIATGFDTCTTVAQCVFDITNQY